VRSLAAAGYREIVLTGVQISAYRSGEHRLDSLVRALLAALEDPGHPEDPEEVRAAPRLRLTSIAPWDIDSRLLALWSDPRLCRHLHLSLQSGSTATLARMRRPYSAAAFARVVAQVRRAVPGVAITTDVIAGFPGETAAEFAESIALVTEMRFAKVHVFPFSPRPGTAAASLPDPVGPDERRERVERLLAVAADSEREFWRANLGHRATVLWERPRRGFGHGLTDNYVRVFCSAGAGLWNRSSEVLLVSLALGGVLGELVPRSAPPGNGVIACGAGQPSHVPAPPVSGGRGTEGQPIQDLVQPEFGQPHEA
ncbi:MAG: radical SAM protein, partial [Acidobacteriota bacterium]|nr:radical SAM protein [Acidobacteriota bacterium]